MGKLNLVSTFQLSDGDADRFNEVLNYVADSYSVEQLKTQFEGSPAQPTATERTLIEEAVGPAQACVPAVDMVDCMCRHRDSFSHVLVFFGSRA